MAEPVCIPCMLQELQLSQASGAGPQAARLGDMGAGHGCFPPTPIMAGSPDVLINGRPAARVGDPLLLHGCGNCPPHPRSISAGSGNVIINGKPAARAGDAIGCGGSISNGSGDVLIGDIGVQGPEQGCLQAAQQAGAAFAAVTPPTAPPAIKTLAQTAATLIQKANSSTPFIT